MGGSAHTEEEKKEVGARPRPRESEVGASFRLLSSGRGVDEVACEEAAYRLSLSLTAEVVVGVSASVSSESLRFSVSVGSVGVSEALGVAAF